MSPSFAMVKRVLFGGRFLLFWGDLVTYSYLNFRFEPLVFLILHDLSDSHISAGQLKDVVGVGVGGKPIFGICVFSVGLKSREVVTFVLLGDLVDRFAIGFDNLQIHVVNPNLSFKKTLVFLDGFGADIKDVSVKLINLFFA